MTTAKDRAGPANSRYIRTVRGWGYQFVQKGATDEDMLQVGRP